MPPNSGESHSENASSPSMVRRAWPYLKWSLFALLLAFVGFRAWGLWTRDPEAFANLDWQPWWLVPAMLAYVAGWLPSVWFWRVMLARTGGTVGWPDAARAYYCGHLGKYIPGKALVLVIREGLLRGRGARPGAAALTAAYETLAMMAVGAALGVALAPTVLEPTVWERATGPLATIWSWAWFRWLWTTPGALPTLVGLVSVAVLPLLAKLASVAAEKMVPGEVTQDPAVADQPGIDTRLFATGMLVLLTAWWVHGLSLGCVVAAVSGTPFDLAHWPAWTSAVSLATSLGFAAIFAPGGAGVREAVLFEVLRVQPGIAPQAAVAASLLLRLTWLVTEIAVAAALYWGLRPRSDERMEAGVDDERPSAPPTTEGLPSERGLAALDHRPGLQRGRESA